ncbi:hypothetical protein F4054_18315 [Candidatus Poribacteria bacterium]|nr:hypothetical protein [Candidatus Poribacteria bacterium]MYG08974.1 hypothetical protein [Candidatus Poribacteria bacterium]MYK24198.1 hypothetical protein [Candidatus Poribacteria bacterium]
MRAAAEFHPGVTQLENEAGRFVGATSRSRQSTKRGGTAEVDACRFRPHNNFNYEFEVTGQSDRRFFLRGSL